MQPKPKKNQKEQWWKDTKFYDGIKSKKQKMMQGKNKTKGKKYATDTEEE